MVGVEWLGIFAFVALSFLFVADLWRAVQNLGWLSLVALLVLPLGFIAADLFTGFSHFFADNFGSEDTPILGHALIFRFRQHHEFPLIICGLTFRELNGGLALVAVPVLLASALLVPVTTTLWGLALGLFLWSSAVFTAATNQFHRWAHDARCPPWARRIQRTGLILSPLHHAGHHRAPHDVRFCITSGWLNDALDRARVWHRIADLLVALGVEQAPESVMGTAARARHGLSGPR